MTEVLFQYDVVVSLKFPRNACLYLHNVLWPTDCSMLATILTITDYSGSTILLTAIWMNNMDGKTSLQAQISAKHRTDCLQ